VGSSSWIYYDTHRTSLSVAKAEEGAVPSGRDRRSLLGLALSAPSPRVRVSPTRDSQASRWR
jgi:hypothetical protein